MDFLELAKARYSCRKFTAQPVEDEKLEKILEAANVAPTGGNLQPIKLWVVRAPENLRKVYDSTPYNFGASTIIVVGGDDSAVRKTGAKDDFLSLAAVNGSIVATHIILAAKDLGLDSTWVGLVDRVQLKKFFPEMAAYTIVCIIQIGYASPEQKGQPHKWHTTRKGVDALTEWL